MLPAEWVDWIWRAWWRLHHDRPLIGGGMGVPIPGRIAWRDVVLWCDRHDYSTAETEFMAGCFVALDTVYLEHWHAEQKAAAARQAARR